MKKGVLKQAGWGLVIAAVLSLCVSTLLFFGVFRELELRALDMRFRWRGIRDVSHSDLIIIAIDAQTFKACPDRYPYPRDYYATLIDNLNEVGIRRIMFDIQFTEPDIKNPQGDQILADAIERAGNVILAGKIERTPTTGGFYEYVEEPLPVLMATGSAWGVVGEIQDPDGFTRRYSIFEQYRDRHIYSLGAEVFLAENNLPSQIPFRYNNGYFLFEDTSRGAKARIRSHRGSMGFEQTILINYYGPERTFPTYSLSSVLDDADFDMRDEEDTDYMELFKSNSVYDLDTRILLLGDSLIQTQAYQALAEEDTQRVEALLQLANPFFGKVALIGVSAEELHDNKFTPFYNFAGKRRMMPGVETHAHAVQTMLDGQFIHPSPTIVNIALIFGLSIITALLVFFTRPVFGGFIAVLIGGATTYGAIRIFIDWAVWIYLVPILVAIVVSYGGNVVYLFLSEQREKKKIRGMFQTYMSPKVLKYLEDHPDAFSLSGEKREATMFFSDVAGFTTISESLSAEELATVLNKYLSPMTTILMSYDGYVDKYEGDAIMCDFGVPMEDPDHAWKACWAAVEQQEKLRVLRPQIKADHGVDIYVRMGVNSGVVSAGNMGSEQRFQYTVMGDAVNQASRFEGANKQYGSYIMIGEETYRRAKEYIEVRILDKLVVKGKLIPITVYELLSKKNELPDDLAQIRDHFTRGIELYWDRQWEQAIECFRQAIAVRSEDAPSSVFIKRCEIFRENPPGANWQGEFVMTTK